VMNCDLYKMASGWLWEPGWIACFLVLERNKGEPVHVRMQRTVWRKMCKQVAEFLANGYLKLRKVFIAPEISQVTPNHESGQRKTNEDFGKCGGR